MRMTKAEKRVEIAKDVLKQIKANKYNPTSGVWVTDTDGNEVGDLIYRIRDEDSEATIDLKNDVVCQLNGKCSVCALGSLFVSAIDKFNHTKLNSGCYMDFTEHACSDYNPLLKWFSAKQLLLIESTFENRYGAWTKNTIWVLSNKKMVYWDDVVIPAIYAYCKKYSDETSRLKAIMNNIVRNKGTFVLPGVKL
jgi:hypothetical protein